MWKPVLVTISLKTISVCRKMQTGEVIAHLRAVFWNKVSLFLKEGEIEPRTLGWRGFIVGFFFFPSYTWGCLVKAWAYGLRFFSLFPVTIQPQENTLQQNNWNYLTNHLLHSSFVIFFLFVCFLHVSLSCKAHIGTFSSASLFLDWCSHSNSGAMTTQESWQ